MAKVAFLGLGVMGYPMAGHLKAKGGHEVTVYNRTAAKAERWVAQFGGRQAPTPRRAAEGQDFVMACPTAARQPAQALTAAATGLCRASWQA